MRQFLQKALNRYRYLDEYGERRNLEEFIMKSQLVHAVNNEYQLEFCRNSKYTTAGCLIWQFNEIWPGCNWTIVDYYGKPKAGYYFYKRAAEFLHVEADYLKYTFAPGSMFKSDIYVVNDFKKRFDNVKVSATIYSFDMKELWTNTVDTSIPADVSVKAFPINWKVPADMKEDVFFLALSLKDEKGQTLSSNFYWFAATRTRPLRGPVYAKLDKLPVIDLKSSASLTLEGNDYVTRVNAENPSKNIGFFVWLKQDSPEEGLISYSDNYFFLMPGEKKTVTIRTQKQPSAKQPARITLEGWNVNKQEIAMK